MNRLGLSHCAWPGLGCLGCLGWGAHRYNAMLNVSYAFTFTVYTTVAALGYMMYGQPLGWNGTKYLARSHSFYSPAIPVLLRYA